MLLSLKNQALPAHSLLMCRYRKQRHQTPRLKWHAQTSRRMAVCLAFDSESVCTKEECLIFIDEVLYLITNWTVLVKLTKRPVSSSRLYFYLLTLFIGLLTLVAAANGRKDDCHKTFDNIHVEVFVTFFL